MMTTDRIKFWGAIAITVIFIGLTVLLLFVELDLGFVKTQSLDTLKGHKTSLEVAQSMYSAQTLAYQGAEKSLQTEKENYSTVKKQYDAISDETVNIIKEATTEENYNIEFMWIKLGNYAKKNNLSLIVVEPGNTAGVASSNDAAKGDTTSGDTSKNDNTNNANNQAATNDKTSGTETKAPSMTTSANTLKIQVTGTYIDVSDFIFEVENDKSLRFKLDNIKMELVNGTSIKATFDIKNILIKK